MRTGIYVTGAGFWIVSAVLIGFGIWVAVDASKYPDWAFQRAGTQKWLFQIVAPVTGFVCGLVTIVLGVIWFASKKAQVDQASRGGPPDGTYGTSQPPPASTWGPPPGPGNWTPPPPPPSHGPATPPPPVPPAPDDPTGSTS